MNYELEIADIEVFIDSCEEGMTMKLHINKYMLFIGTIILLNLKGFTLIPNLPVDIADITIVVEAIFWFYVFFTCKNRNKNRYGWMIIFVAVLVASSAFMAKLSYVQPLFMGIRAQRAWLVSMFMYFPINRLVKSGRITIRQILEMLDTINFIYMFIVIIQFIVGPEHLFLNVRNSIRYGTLRIAVAQSFLCISYFYNLKKILTQKKCLKSILFVVCTLFVIIFINKGRTSTIILVVPSLLMILLSKLSKKKLAIVGISVVVGIAFLNSAYGVSLVDSVIGKTAVDPGTLIREVGREFYTEQVLKSPINTILGCGYANIDWPETVTGIRYEEGITYDDNGIFGLVFYYGFIMLAWILVFIIWLMHDSYKYGRKIYIFMLLRSFIGIMTLFPECYTTHIGFVILCVIIESRENIEDKVMPRLRQRTFNQEITEK